MSHTFKPIPKNAPALIRPGSFFQKPNTEGIRAATRLLKLTTLNRLNKDVELNKPIKLGKPHRPVAFHEPNWKKWRRIIREKITKQWKCEVKNTAELALWYRFRVYAEYKYDYNKYNEYLNEIKREKLRKLRQLKEGKSFELNDIIQLPPKKRINISEEEKNYRDSQKPEAYLESLRNNYIDKTTLKTNCFDEWKNDIKHLKRNESKILDNDPEFINDVNGYDWFKNLENTKKIVNDYQKDESINLNESINYDKIKERHESIMDFENDPNQFNKSRLQIQCIKDNKFFNDIRNEIKLKRENANKPKAQRQYGS